MRIWILALVTWLLGGCAPAGSGTAPRIGMPAAGEAQTRTLSRAEARHLLVRTGFGATEREVEALTGLTRLAAVETVLAGLNRRASVPLPAGWARYIPESRGEPAQRATAWRELRAWWFSEMLRTSSPLTERLTLFWQGYFGLSGKSVGSPALMARYNVMLRARGTDNFAALLHSVVRDPAMLVGHDAGRNRTEHLDESYARTLLDTFTVGPDHHSAEDVTETARALTGWSVDPETGEARFRFDRHDDGEKTVVGRQGRYDADSVVDALLVRPETARRVTQALWREFVSPVPDAEQAEVAAGAFRNSGYEMHTILRALLLSDAFWAAGNRGVLVRSPVDLVVGTYRMLDMPFADPAAADAACAGLGQDVFAPPPSGGWPEGPDWFVTGGPAARRHFLETVLAAPAGSAPHPGQLASAGAPGGFDATRWFANFPAADLVPRVVSLVLPGPPAATAPGSLPDTDWLRSLLLDPGYEYR